ADGCDIPAAWCDVMHLDTPHRHGGPLTLDNTGLGCRHHHRAYDHGRLTLHRHPDGTPTLHQRDGPDP
ncbi:MAG: hypothetical protein R3343_13175, partial [Nitriliruptorales bacterium]|nr:hypothetical protein [Nitriliruptorales bacterium]